MLRQSPVYTPTSNTAIGVSTRRHSDAACYRLVVTQDANRMKGAAIQAGSCPRFYRVNRERPAWEPKTSIAGLARLLKQSRSDT